MFNKGDRLNLHTDFFRNGIQNCEECIYNMLGAPDCFSNIRSYLLGRKFGNIVSGEEKRTVAMRAFQKFKAKAKGHDKEQIPTFSLKVRIDSTVKDA